MFTFAVVVRRMVDHWKISNRTALMALVQFISRWLRSPVRVMPNSLKGAGSIEKPVVGVIWRSSGAFPKRAYLVLETLVARPDSFLKSSSTRRMLFGWVVVGQEKVNVVCVGVQKLKLVGDCLPRLDLFAVNLANCICCISIRCHGYHIKRSPIP